MRELKCSCAADVRYLGRWYVGAEAQLGGGWAVLGGAGMRELRRSWSADERYLGRWYAGTESQLGGGWRMCVTWGRWYAGTETQLCGRCAEPGVLVYEC